MILALFVLCLVFASVRWAGITGYAGEAFFLVQYIKNQDLVFHLYTNNLNPNPSNVPSDFTELALSGYAAQTVHAGGWTITNPVGSFYTQANAANLTFLWSGAATIYGYYVTDQSNNLAGAEYFGPGGIVFGVSANAFVISPQWNAI